MDMLAQQSNPMIRKCAYGLLIMSFWCGAALAESEPPAALTITDLRCDYVAAPNGIDHQSPNFGWVLTSAERGQRQTAYQLIVHDDQHKLLWDSGKVSSSESSHVKYKGKRLNSSSHYGWKVRVWDRQDRPTEYTKRAHFGTALMDAKEWKAEWIGRGPVEEPVAESDQFVPNRDQFTPDLQSTLLRKEITLTKSIRQATIHVSGLGLFELYVNGSKIGRTREHVPLRTHYSEQVLYSTYDITGSLLQGANAIGLMLGNGWYNTQQQYWGWRMQWWGFPKAIAQVRVCYTDGSEETIVSDPSWKTAAGPVVSSCLYDGEVYDARLEQPGWNRAGFDDALWAQASPVQAPAGELMSQLAPPITVTETIRPRSVQQVSPGVFVFDMGQNFSGWTRIEAKGARGTSIQLRHAENINGDGTLNVGTLRRAQNTDTYILKGGDTAEIYEPHFTSHGFRYVEITGYPGTPTTDDVLGCVAHSDCEIVGAFECDNELINHLYRCAFWTQRSILQGLPVDCPQRDERLGWGADAHVQAESSMYVLDMHQFYAKWLRDFQVQQCKLTGNLQHISPWPWVEGYPCWSAAYPIILWHCYTYYGDKQLLAAHYDNLKRYVEFLRSQSTGHIQPRDDSGDWMSSVEKVRGGPLLISTAFYYYCTRILADTAKVLGKTEDSEKYGNMAEEITAAFNNVFLRDSGRRGYPYGENSQCENALPLFFGFVPERAKARVIGNLVNDIQKQECLTTGFIGTKYVMDTLTLIGYPDIGYRLLVKETHPSWSNMTKGRTTMTETWSAGGSHNHAGLGGSVIAWIYKTLAGINPDPEKPGFERVLIRPYMPHELNMVTASVRTIKGTVESAWEKADGTVTLKVSIPANMSALVYLPSADASSVKEGSLNAAQSPGVQCRGKENNMLLYEIESGRYEFIIHEKPAESSSE
jgi:alpha-L-rhamnosidase